MTNTSPVAELDKLRPLKEGAKLSGLKYHHLQRATKRGLVRTYSLGTSRRFVTLRDIFEAASSAEAPSIFAECAQLYRDRGFWPRPITEGSKACHLRDWQRPDFEILAAELGSWPAKYGQLGFGLLVGSRFPDDTTLGALDIDHDDYVRVGRALLRDPPSGRIGKKGAVFFVRGRLSNPEFRVAGKGDKVAECLFTKKLCVIPPTIHPDTGRPYQWIGKPLHEVDFNELPMVGMNNA